MRHTFEPIAEDMLSRVKIRVRGDDGEQMLVEVTAIAIVNEWAATPDQSRDGRYAITHVPTGLAAITRLTARDAVRTVGKLRDVRVSADYTEGDRAAILSAFPAHVRRKLTLSSGNPDKVRASIREYAGTNET